MSKVYYCSDLHWGHKNIPKYRSYVETWEHNIELIKELWHKTVTKRDTVWCHGDILFHSKYLDDFSKLPGNKILVLGNHCFQQSDYDNWKALSAFSNVFGAVSKHGSWHTHIPIVASELRGKYNVHGHLHVEHVLNENGERDRRYFNVNMDMLYPVINNMLIESTIVKDCLINSKLLEEVI